MAFSKDASIKKIKDLAAIVSQEKFAAVMGDLAEAEGAGSSEQEKIRLLERAKKDSKAFLEGQGIKLPANATVEITQNSPIGVRICLNSHCVTISISAV